MHTLYYLYDSTGPAPPGRTWLLTPNDFDTVTGTAASYEGVLTSCEHRLETGFFFDITATTASSSSAQLRASPASLANPPM